jgi:hypothetical protein
VFAITAVQNTDVKVKELSLIDQIGQVLNEELKEPL